MIFKDFEKLTQVKRYVYLKNVDKFNVQNRKGAKNRS